MRVPAFLPIEFIIVGGSVCGLSSAIALCRAGHKVTVFDPRDPFEHAVLDAGCRLPPNSTKVYYRWGMEERLRKIAIKSRGTLFGSFDSGDVVGEIGWEQDVLEETGGDFLLMHHTDFRRVLAECAIEHGAKLRYGSNACRVKTVIPDSERPSVELHSGEVVSADVIVCADGVVLQEGISRPMMSAAYGFSLEPKKNGMRFFSFVLPEADMDILEDKAFVQQLRAMGETFYWSGARYAALGHPLAPTTGAPLFTVQVVAPMEKHKPEAFHLAEREVLLEILECADSRLRALATHAEEVYYVEGVHHPALDEWIHPQGRVICLGEAAHPHPMGSVYALGTATGDAAVLGHLFSHLHRHDQIDFFLNATQQIRQPRVKNLMRAFTGNTWGLVLPPALAEARDRHIREQAQSSLHELAHAHGHADRYDDHEYGHLQSSSGEMEQIVESVFGYDPEDEADDWWFEWGRMQERAQRTPSPSGSEASMPEGKTDFASMFASMSVGAVVVEEVTVETVVT